MSPFPTGGAFDSALSTDFSAYGSRQGPAAGLPQMEESTESRSLGQLASVFEVVARLDPDGELRRLSNEVLDERRELERQLDRRRDFERQLKEVRTALDSLRDERRRVEFNTAGTQRRISHLQDELAFVEAEVRAAEGDLEMLRDASGPGAGLASGLTPYTSRDEERRDVLSKVRAERELLQRDQQSIEDIRVKLDEIFKQKLDAQTLQQTLLEKQRQTEQDRGLMLTAIEAERGKLSQMRAERLKLWEERSALEREMADVAQEQWLSAGVARPGAPDGPVRGPGVPATRQFNTAPAETPQQQRLRGVRHEEPPSVIYGSLPPAVDQAPGFRPPLSGSIPGSAPVGTNAPKRADHRGVRN